MKLILFSILSTLTATLFFSGCATIVDGKQQQLNLVSSKPHQVSINGQIFQAPSMITIDRPKEKLTTATVSDCNKKVLLKRKMNGQFWGNILFGGLPGSTTDSATGAMWEYDNTNVDVNCPND